MMSLRSDTLHTKPGALTLQKAGSHDAIVKAWRREVVKTNGK